MAVDWSFMEVDSECYGPTDAEPFAPHPFTPEELDVMLVGSMKGSVVEALRETAENTKDMSELGGILPAEAVKRFAARLASIKRSDFAPLAVVLRESMHFVERKDEQDFYEDLVRAVDRLQRFVSEAANQNCAIRLEVS